MSQVSRNLDPAYVNTLEILDSAEAAVYLRTAMSTLAKKRVYGGGPAFIMRSKRKALYRRADLDAWLAGRDAAAPVADASPPDPGYIAMLEEAVLDGERYASDIEASRRKGYSPRPLFEAADAIRARRRSSGT